MAEVGGSVGVGLDVAVVVILVVTGSALGFDLAWRGEGRLGGIGG